MYRYDNGLEVKTYYSYWFKQGNVAYEFSGDISQLETFKFVGWN
jgi:hypothetical protein